MSGQNQSTNTDQIEQLTSKPNSGAPAKNKTPKKPKGIERNFSKEVEIYHDAFRLDPAEMLKNMSWIKAEPKYKAFQHCHVFHTFDSSGRQQFYSTPTGGHFHKMEFKKHDDGTISVACISGPLKWGTVWDPEQERHVRQAVPVNPRDKHRHETTYLHSEKLVKRKRNVEAAKLLAQNAKLGAKPEGVE